MQASLETLFERGSITILDGGLGTTLEDTFHKNISGQPLWSAKLIDEDPKVVVELHLRFLQAGAQVICTSSYQCAFNTFERAGYTREQATRSMLRSVQLAQEARARYQASRIEMGLKPRPIWIALALGPFGATQSPAQEYDGFYPPPFGPKAYSLTGNNRTAFTDVEREEGLEAQAEDALMAFHLERLRIFARDIDAWRNIDCIAFETVPLAREATAIRRAVGSLYEHISALHSGSKKGMKPWWISFVFPDGRHPQEIQIGGRRLTILELVNATLSGPGGNADDYGRQQVAIPNGVGINCTRLEFVPGIIAELDQAVQSCRDRLSSPLWFVLYPNGGETYDIISQTWRKASEGQVWEQEVTEIVKGMQHSNTWMGVLVGGCCKTSPDSIRDLAARIEKMDDASR